MSGINQIRAVAFQEGEIWVVQGIEYDIVAQTKDPLDAPIAFLKALISTVVINEKLGRKGLERIGQAPDRFREMFENADVSLSQTGPSPLEENRKRPDINLRAYRHA